MGRRKKIVEVELTDEELYFFENSKVENPRFLSGTYIKWFNEDSYINSLKEAYRWAREDVGEAVIEFVNYYPQIHMHKNILLSYNIK